jgi:hypothetical protein
MIIKSFTFGIHPLTEALVRIFEALNRNSHSAGDISDWHSVIFDQASHDLRSDFGSLTTT